MSKRMEIGIFSGKGGTGKTTLTACFGALAERYVAVDCDVDAANLAILMPGEDGEWTDFYSGTRARILEERCVQCGECEAACRFDAIHEIDGSYRVQTLACEGCNACSLACPVDAIVFDPNHAGRWTVRRTAKGMLVHGTLMAAQDNSGKLVAQVKAKARELADAEGIPLILTDGPPGIGCPVHAAMTQVTHLLAVTEPTPSGEHDLLRLLDLAAHFRIRAAVVINKWNLDPAGSARLEARAREKHAPVLARIPFDPAIPRLLSQGRLPLEPPASPETIAAIHQAWEAITAPEGQDPWSRTEASG